MHSAPYLHENLFIPLRACFGSNNPMFLILDSVFPEKLRKMTFLAVNYWLNSVDYNPKIFSYSFNYGGKALGHDFLFGLPNSVLLAILFFLRKKPMSCG